jgi:uncharacterized protein YbjT (DUF2867 family)
MVKTPCVAVFGGSGKTGGELIAVALKKGVLVRALYRPGSESSRTPGLEIITGQLTEPGDIRLTLEGTDGAILVFGPRLGRHARPEAFCAGATSLIIAEMKRLGIGRLICQTGAMAGGDTPNWSKMVRMFVGRYRKQFPAINKDRDAQEVAVKESGLDWTLAKPFRIAGGRGKGRVRVASSIRIGPLTSIRRTDLAEFLIDECLMGSYHKQAVYIVN